MFAERPCRISCWRAAWVSQSYGRLPHPCRKSGSYRVVRRPVPKVCAAIGPQPPLAAGFVRSQSLRGSNVPLALFQERDVALTDDTIGLISSAYAVVTACTKRPTFALIAVLPSPNTSYAMPNRGLRSFQF